jgi:hypothetical protein
VCRKCEFQVRSWCGAAETWAKKGTDGVEELLQQVPMGRSVAVRCSRRLVLMRARLLLTIREKEVSICKRELLDRFMECYRRGKPGEVVGEWRVGKVKVKDESVVLPRPRAGAAARGKLR